MTRIPGIGDVGVMGIVLVVALLGTKGDMALALTLGGGVCFLPGSSGALTGCAGSGPALTYSAFRNFQFLLRTLPFSALTRYSLSFEPKSIIVPVLVLERN